MTTAREALAFVRKHGFVLQAAHVAGIPVLVDFIAGTAIRGSWWGHAKGREIFAVLNEVHDSGEVVAIRLIQGKLTLAHRRVWGALVAVADEIGRSRLGAVREVHTRSGRHKTITTPFPEWVPREVQAAAARMDRDEARAICAAALA